MPHTNSVIILDNYLQLWRSTSIIWWSNYWWGGWRMSQLQNDHYYQFNNVPSVMGKNGQSQHIQSHVQILLRARTLIWFWQSTVVITVINKDCLELKVFPRSRVAWWINTNTNTNMKSIHLSLTRLHLQSKLSLIFGLPLLYIEDAYKISTMTYHKKLLTSSTALP